jgi:hypothetical protein
MGKKYLRKLPSEEGVERKAWWQWLELMFLQKGNIPGGLEKASAFQGDLHPSTNRI